METVDSYCSCKTGHINRCLIVLQASRTKRYAIIKYVFRFINYFEVMLFLSYSCAALPLKKLAVYFNAE